MPEQAQTVGELLRSMEKHDVVAHKEVTKDEPEFDARNDGFWMGYHMAQSRLDPILDALVGCQGRVIYTAEDVAAAAKAAYIEFLPTGPMLPWRKLGSDDRAEWCELARAAITAAGGVVVDEVVELTGPLLWVKQNSEVVEMNDGDILYIQRVATRDKED